MKLTGKWITGPRWAMPELSLETQQLLSDLAEHMYDPYDCTDLQELAARAYLLGKED